MGYVKTMLTYEVIEKAAKAKTKKEKIKILQENETQVLKDVLRGTFDKTIQWNLPGGTPPYEPTRPESVPSNLQKFYKGLFVFVKGTSGENMPAVRREKIFIDMLESVHPQDAELLINMINKKPPATGITKALIKEAFPGLIKE